MAEFLLFCTPALIYIFVQSRGKNHTFSRAMARIGATWGDVSAYKLALLLLLPLLLVGWLSIVLIPPDVRSMPGVVIAQITSVGVALAVILRAIGEEVFFRGLLGGVFIRRLGFLRGNLLQATIFLIPHMLLLFISPKLWVILPVQFIAGWLMGWLRHKTGTFVPGAVVHAAVNIAAGLIIV